MRTQPIAARYVREGMTLVLDNGHTGKVYKIYPSHMRGVRNMRLFDNYGYTPLLKLYGNELVQVKL